MKNDRAQPGRKRIAKRVALALVALLVSGLVGLLARAEYKLAQRHAPPLPSLHLDSASRARGEHLSHTYGCRHCHGDDLAGNVMEDSAAMYISAPNLTPASSRVAHYRAEDWARALLNGVDPDGRPLLLMPSHHLRVISDDDLNALVGYLQDCPAVERTLPPAELHVLGKLLLGAGAELLAAELIDQHTARAPVHEAPVAATLAHGQYLTRACAGCHGADLQGGPAVGPPGSPKPPAIAGAVMASWTKPQFVRALREGKKRDGSQLDDMMPWKALRHLSDTELDALWIALNARN